MSGSKKDRLNYQTECTPYKSNENEHYTVISNVDQDGFDATIYTPGNEIVSGRVHSISHLIEVLG